MDTWHNIWPNYILLFELQRLKGLQRDTVYQHSSCLPGNTIKSYEPKMQSAKFAVLLLDYFLTERGGGNKLHLAKEALSKSTHVCVVYIKKKCHFSVPFLMLARPNILYYTHTVVAFS